MALPKLFQRIFWHNNTTPAINEDNLNAMSQAIDGIDDRVIGLAGTIMEDVPQIQEDIEELEEDFALIDEKIADATSEANRATTEANRATTKANEAAASVISAGNKALISEGYAKGTQNGTPVGSSSPYYHNNAEYFKEQARSFTPTGYQDLVDDVAEAQEAITDIEGEKVSSNDAYVLRQCKGNSVDLGLVGGSVAWNQLVDKSRFSDSNYLSTLRCTTSVSNTEITVTATESDPVVRFILGIPVPTNHVVLILADFKPTTATTKSNIVVRESAGSSISVIATSPNKAFSANINSKFNFMFKANTAVTELRVDYYLDSDSAVSGVLNNNQLIDLTQKFGSTIADYIYSLEQATAGAGVAWFRQYFPNAYYAYNAGSIKSVNPSARKVVGKNLATTKIYKKDYVLSPNGTENSNSSYLITDVIPIINGKTYYISFKKGLQSDPDPLRVGCYDSNMNFIERLSISSNGVLTLPLNTKYLRLSYCYDSSQTAYTYDIQLEFGSTATDYEPYKEYTFPFDSSKQLRGIPKLVDNKLSYDGDIYTADGTVTRKYGIVDLGTLDWTANTSQASGKTYFVSNSSLTNSKGNFENAICAKGYEKVQVSSVGATNMSMSLGGNYQVYIRDDTYNGQTADAFKTAMSGVCLVYELATPTTESANAYQNPQRAFIDGTEEFVDAGVTASTRDVSIPVGNESEYNTSEVLPISQDYTDGAMEILKEIVASSSDFANFKTKVAAL